MWLCIHCFVLDLCAHWWVDDTKKLEWRPSDEVNESSNLVLDGCGGRHECEARFALARCEPSIRTYVFVRIVLMIHVESETPSQTHFSFISPPSLTLPKRYETLCRRKSLIVQRHRRPHSILFKHVLLTSSRIRLQARAMRSF